MACYIYVLRSALRTGYRTYVGWTVNLEQRVKRHNDGVGAKSTRGRHWVLLYAERYDNRCDATPLLELRRQIDQLIGAYGAAA